jgi:hypothetical protein
LSIEFELFFSFFLGLPLFMPFVGFVVFLLLDDLIELFFSFWSSSCASCVLVLKFKLCAFVFSMYSSRGRLGNQVVSTLV